MSLQERIEELGSGILEITESEVKLIGFTCEERLKDFYEKIVNAFLQMEYTQFIKKKN